MTTQLQGYGWFEFAFYLSCNFDKNYVIRLKNKDFQTKKSRRKTHKTIKKIARSKRFEELKLLVSIDVDAFYDADRQCVSFSVRTFEIKI